MSYLELSARASHQDILDLLLGLQQSMSILWPSESSSQNGVLPDPLFF
jgi:hypothetical protein